MIVPLTREDFFDCVCAPALRRNNPLEILAFRGPENANIKRNEGAKQATQPYLLFCDDDVELHPDCLSTLLTALRDTPKETAFAYSDFRVHKTKPGYAKHGDGTIVHSAPYSFRKLLWGNYIAMSTVLMKAETFLGFDENLESYQDWDLWLRYGLEGFTGKYVPEVLLTVHFIDPGIRNTVSGKKSRDYLSRKVKMLMSQKG